MYARLIKDEPGLNLGSDRVLALKMLPLISFSVLEHTGTHTHVHKHTSAHLCIQRKRDGENEREK